MNPEQQLNNLENNKILKSIEIPKQEIETLNSIFSFINQVSFEEYERFSGPIGYSSGISARIEELFRKKMAEVEANQSLSQQEKSKLGFKARREAEYEACADVINYKNEQLKKVVEFAESQKIWKAKFSTASNIDYSQYRYENTQAFVDDLGKSEEYHKEMSFAGQNLNSLYYVSNSGVSLRLKMEALHPNGNILDAVQQLAELSICVDDITDRSNQEIKAEGDLFERPLKTVSFTPKVGYRVEEFYTDDFRNHEEGNFKSKIKVLEDDNKIVVKDFDGSHSGHYINKIYNVGEETK